MKITKTAQYHDATNDKRYLIFSWYLQLNSPKQFSTMMLQMTGVISFFMVSHKPHTRLRHNSSLTHTHPISHNYSHIHLTQTSHTHTSHTQLISQTPHLTQLLSHTSHAHLISHTPHLTQLLSHISHTPHLTNTPSYTISLTYISHKPHTHLTHNSSPTHLI